MEKSDERVIRMYLCEVQHVFLKPDRLYKFEVDMDCENCKRLALHSKGL